uniref:Uncharacterized protein n=1 Tax=Vespula pensylvanica TaxID=30213 RepID=A0A834KHJ4_VESPE|nr:hypothetical protein H0235_014840 [Vespula pensylvanica]
MARREEGKTSRIGVKGSHEDIGVPPKANIRRPVRQFGGFVAFAMQIKKEERDENRRDTLGRPMLMKNEEEEEIEEVEVVVVVVVVVEEEEEGREDGFLRR